MKVWLIVDAWNKEVYGVFSSEEKAKFWLENKATQEWGWTRGDVASCKIEPWDVDSGL